MEGATLKKIRTPDRTIKALKIILDNQDTGIYKYAICRHLQILDSNLNLEHMLEDELIYIDREVQSTQGKPRKYYKICREHLPYAKHLVKEELSFWNGKSKHIN